MSKIDLSKPPLIKEGGLLVKLWRDIVEKNNLIHKLDYLITEYVAKNNNSNQVTRRKSKHTLIANVCSQSMTWNVFLENIKLAKFKRMEITIKVTDQRGNKTEHTLPVIMTVIGDEDDDKTTNDEC